MYSNEMDKDEIIRQLQEELDATKLELSATKEHLKKYTAPERNKKYYEANREELIAGMRKYYYDNKKIKVSHDPITIKFS